jgi:hypothetical protein
VRIKNLETAAGDKRRNFPTAEAQLGVGRKHRIRQDARRVIIRINRAGRQVIGKNGVVRWERSSYDFINANSRSRQCSVDAPNETNTRGSIGPVEQSGLFHGAAEFAEPNNLKRVHHAAAKLLLDIGATGGHDADKDHRGKERNCISHTHRF